MEFTVTEDAYSITSVTFDLLKDATKDIPLPTLTIPYTGCYDTSWRVHLSTDDTNMVTSKPAVFSI